MNSRRKPTPQHGLHRQKTGRCSVLQSVFIVMFFVSQRNAAHLFFLKGREKNKRAAPPHRTKTHANKNCLKLH
jgi:hypothetical protein